MRLQIASAAMNVAVLKSGTYNVFKFDFPNINLLDSSHHGQCTGCVIFNIKTKPGLATGTAISNHAGIFFDDNPVVLTDTAVNVIGLSPITGPANVCVGAAATLVAPVGFPGGAWSSSSAAIATVGTAGVVAGVSASTATITYSVTGACGVAYTTQPIVVNPLPASYAMTGGGAYCAADSGVHIGLAGSQAGVNYLLYHGATATGPFAGSGTAVDFGLQTVAGAYTVMATNSATTCSVNLPGTATVSITPSVVPSVSISVTDTVCAGASTTYTPIAVNGGSSPTYEWSVNGINVGMSATYTFVPAYGDIVTVTLNSSEPCAYPASVSSVVTMVVELPVTLTVAVSASPGTAIAAGEEVTLSAALSGSGDISSFQWLLNGAPISGATNASYTSSALSNNDSVTCVVTTGNVCGAVTAVSSVKMTVINDVVPTTYTGRERIKLSPNPNNGSFTISGLTDISVMEAGITVLNLMGQVVYKEVTAVANGAFSAYLSPAVPLPRGIYLLNLQLGADSKIVRFTVE